MLFLPLLLVWGISTAIPNLQDQILILLRNAPSYISRANSETGTLVETSYSFQFSW